MTPRGYQQPLYILPFDHRGSFETKMFGWHEPLSDQQTAEIAAAKQVIYDGFKVAIAGGMRERERRYPRRRAVRRRDPARRIGQMASTSPARPKRAVRKSSTSNTETTSPRTSRAFHPTFCKVLVRYNPEGDKAMNQAQASRLRRLSEYLQTTGRSLFMFELLVPAEKAQLDKVKGDKKAYDLEIRPRLMIQTIHEMQDAGVEPDIWKIEGLDRKEDCEKIVVAARRNGRDKVGCIILGRGEDEATSAPGSPLRQASMGSSASQ